MRRSYGAILVLLLGLAAVWAQDPPKQAADKKDAPAAAGFSALEKEFQEAQQAALKAFRAAKADERQKAQQEYFAVSTKFAARVKEYLEKNPKADDVVDAWIWTFRNVNDMAQRNAALETLAKNHLDNPKLAALTPMLGRSQGATVDKILRTFVEKGKDDATRGTAMLILAQNLKARAELVPMLQKADEATTKQNESFYGAEFIKSMKTADAAKFSAESEALFDKVAKEFTKEKYGQGTLADAAKGELYEIRNLAVGKTIPEIDGEDLDGVKFKLSDYRGKVVLIDFWGHW